MNKPVVAIVDDDPRVLASLVELLESGGYGTRSFLSGEALLASGLEGVDVLITDIGMPGADGFELRDLARQTNPQLPIFLITGRHEIADQQRARGIDGFLRKPFDGHTLLAAVRKALDDRQC
ncbi:response regulator [Phyllobacterium endophyticum]|jgi:FixJ family two-component response regulator|uniref:Response regulator n=1 Tax=Phyllobacterium endophyticum TaxID=1149773 RepID=A0A2P7AKN3_9HYPH|nr:response regulator [Phyllobacterium endophyticum]MBB3233350.1 FixJ family two-component response regulator [Phyllobacterium endophyticum]PSH54779.1 response regulator [Phyllobacterium endophyticum]TXR47630.1 response regulator [Phyllobacterium endophyticum]TYR43354.1 response regulator [Phyllobacterium endophyticum]